MCRWSLIAGRLPGRTDNEIKNYWNSHLSKKVSEQQDNTLKTLDRNSQKKNLVIDSPQEKCSSGEEGLKEFTNNTDVEGCDELDMDWINKFLELDDDDCDGAWLTQVADPFM